MVILKQLKRQAIRKVKLATNDYSQKVTNSISLCSTIAKLKPISNSSLHSLSLFACSLASTAISNLP